MTERKTRSLHEFTKYPATLEIKLGFDKVIAIVESKCMGPLGFRFVKNIRPIVQPDLLRLRLQQVDEFKKIIENKEVFPVDDYIDLSDHLQMLSIENSVLSAEQFIQVYRFSFTAMGIFSFLVQGKETYPVLACIINNKPFDRKILQDIRKVLDEDGNVREEISPALGEIRKGIRKAEGELDRKFRQVLDAARSNGWLSEGEESIRGGRRVISLQAEHKRKIKGIIHDESASGKTIFLEPEKIIEISNDIFELKLEERREIYRIFKELTARLRPFIPMLREYQEIAGIIDFTRAKALMATDMDAHYFEIEDKPCIQLEKARHPLLYLLNKASGKKTVPLDVSLDEHHRILVISGPNAGGKSVCLKTIGLLQLMLQCGMLVPAGPSSKGGIFHDIFADIGDEQSIENDLSTYTSHLQHMKFFMQNAGSNTLFMIDEFGTGTDPQLGGAIAEAILADISRKKAFGVITTHYSNLKLFADQTPGIINGSMLFDQQNLAPTYQLMVGKPGSSYAFEMARNIGIRKEILDAAKKKAGAKTKNFDELLADLEQEKLFMAQREIVVKEKEVQLQSLIDTYSRLKNELEENRVQLLLENKEKALAVMAETNREMEKLLKEISEQKQKGEKKVSAQPSREKLQQERERLKEEVKQLKKKAADQPLEEIKEGSYVILPGSNQAGKVEQLRKKRAVVVFGDLRTVVNVDELKPAKKPVAKEKTSRGGFDYHQSAMNFSPELDLRGMRREEALEKMEVFIDKAMLLNHEKIRIIHGRGQGILRDAVRGLLKKYARVKEVYEETADTGGDGITIVEFK